MDDPIARFERSHRELEAWIAVLAEKPADAGARAELLGFLEGAMLGHEDDEETSLFPRLAHLPELAQTIAMLREEHRSQGNLQRALREAHDETSVARALAGLQASYARHFALEESVVFPATRAALDGDALRAMTAEMAARRGR